MNDELFIPREVYTKTNNNNNKMKKKINDELNDPRWGGKVCCFIFNKYFNPISVIT
jgi:hypothetical protein